VLALAVAAAVVTLAYLSQYPLILGRWEDLTTFPMMFSRTGPPLSFELYQPGEIDGDHYPLLGFGYYTAELFGWSFLALRLPAIVGGLAAIATFFGLSARWYGFWPALLAAVALAFNPTFFVFSHQLLVPIVSLVFVLLAIERYQLIERSRHLLWTVPTFALVFALLLQQYAPGRLYGCALVAYWFVWLAGSSIRARRNGLRVNRAALLAFPAFLALVVAFSVLLDTRNLQHLTPQLVLPSNGEYVTSAAQLRVLRDNLAVELNAVVPLLALAPGRLGQFSSDLVVDIRTYVLPASMLPLAVLGAAVAIGQLRHRSSARLTLFLLVVMFAAPLFSARMGGHLSISSFRMFYLLIPLYVLAAAGTAWLFARKARGIQVVGCAAAFLLVAAQVVGASTEINRDNAFVVDLARRWQPGAPLAMFGDIGGARATPEYELQTNGSYQYYFLQVPPLAAAARILDRVPPGSSGGDVVIVRLIGSVQPDHAMGPIRLVFYLRSLGASAALFDSTYGTLRGARFRQPEYVIADGPEAAAAAARVVSTTGRGVRMLDFQWSP
jgi:hypothetical protein